MDAKILAKDHNIFYHKDSILTCYRGSIAHNMYVPDTDPGSIDYVDLLRVFVPPIDNYFGLKEFGSRGTKESFIGEYDIVTYEIRKFIRMLWQGNPNVLGSLWLKDSHYIKKTSAGELLIKNRDIFIGKHAYNSFVGCARSHLKKMQNRSYNGYMGTKRKKLVDKYGYDVKDAAHVIRMLIMCIEFLQTGEMIVFRPDAQYFLDIKQGKWPLKNLNQVAGELFARAEYEYERSKLPKGPDVQKVNSLCVKIVQTAFEEE